MKPWVMGEKEYAGAFDEAEHPRGGKGSPDGGKFVAKGGGEGQASVKFKSAADPGLHDVVLSAARMVKAPEGFGGFGVATETTEGKLSRVSLLLRLPREVRHPDEYRLRDDNPDVQKWNDFDQRVQEVADKLSARLGVPVDVTGGSFGTGIVTWKKAGESSFGKPFGTQW
jgi:hypothetical protein